MVTVRAWSSMAAQTQDHMPRRKQLSNDFHASCQWKQRAGFAGVCWLIALGDLGDSFAKQSKATSMLKLGSLKLFQTNQHTNAQTNTQPNTQTNKQTNNVYIYINTQTNNVYTLP